MIVCCGGSAGGYSLFVKDGKLTYENNFFSKERDVIVASEAMPAGRVEVVFEYVQEGKGWGEGGSGRLFVNGNLTGEAKFAHVVPARYSATETFDVGEDTGSPASNQYQGPFRFTGEVRRVVVEILTEEDPHADRRAGTEHQIRIAIE